MSLGHGATIPQDSIAMLVDATNTKSYSGSGSSWIDLVGNRTFSSAGTQTPFETKAGVKSFAFNGSGYWYSDTNTSGVDMGGDCTLLMWIYSEGIAERDTLFEKAGTSYNSYQQEIAVTWETNSALSYYTRYSPNYDYGTTTSFTLNGWSLMGIRMSTGKTTSARAGYYSKNGAAWVSSYVSRSNTAVLAAGQIRIGSGYAGTVEAGNVGLVATYNKQLSNAEVNQFFNATRGRFGV
jgi:hypothetical protein